MKLVLLFICIAFAGLAAAACPYNGCKHPSYPTVELGTCSTSTCVCKQGFKNPSMGCTEVDTTTCPTSCNNGNCVTAADGKKQCVCNSGYAGPLCDVQLCTDNCNGNGDCVSGSCTCYPGYTGTNCNVGTTPTFLSAVFATDWRSITVTFSADSNMAGMTGDTTTKSVDCSTVLEAATMTLVHSSAKCTWSSATKLGVHLSAHATIKVGDSINLKSGVVKDVTGTNGLTSGLTRSITSGTALTPKILYSAPDYIGKCNDLIIDATMSSGLASRPANYTFSVVSGTNVTIPAESKNGYLKLTAAELAKSLEHPNLVQIVKFSVVVKNSFGTTSAAQTVTVIRKPYDIVAVTIDQPKSIKWPYVSNKNLKFKANFPTCGLGAATGFTYKWYIFGGSLGAALTGGTESSSFIINPGVLKPGNSYTIQVSVAATGLSSTYNGTAMIFVDGKDFPLNTFVAPTEGEAYTGAGLKMTAFGGNSFGMGDTVAGRAFTFECKKASSGAWSGTCEDATAVPGTALTLSNGASTSSMKVLEAAANKLSPGRYRFRFTLAATGRTTVTSEWSVWTVKADSASGVFRFGPADMSTLVNRVTNGKLFSVSGGLSAPITVSCTDGTDLVNRVRTSYGVTIQNIWQEGAWTGFTELFAPTANGVGNLIVQECKISGTTDVLKYKVYVPVALNPMPGKFDFTPKTGVDLLSKLTYIVDGYYQPDIGEDYSRIALYKWDSERMSSYVPRVQGLPPASTSTTFKMDVYSMIDTHTEHTEAFSLTIGAISGTVDEQVDKIQEDLVAKADEVLKAEDPDDLLAVAADFSKLLATYTQPDKQMDAATKAKVTALVDKSLTLMSNAAEKLAESPDINTANTFLAQAESQTNIVNPTQFENLLSSASSGLNAVTGAVTTGSRISDNSLNSVINMISKVSTGANHTKSVGSSVTKLFSGLSTAIIKQTTKGIVQIKKDNAALTVVVKPTTTAISFPGTVKGTKPAMKMDMSSLSPNIGSLSVSQTDFNSFGLNSTGGTDNSNGVFFGATFYGLAASPISDISDPAKGGQAGLAATFSSAFKVPSGYDNVTLYHYDTVKNIWEARANATLVNGVYGFATTKFSQFGLFPTVEVPSEVDMTAITIAVLFGLVFFVVAGLVGYRYGPEAVDKFIKKYGGRKTVAAAGARGGRAMLFYDPNAEPGEEWVQVQSGSLAGAEAERTKKQSEQQEGTEMMAISAGEAEGGEVAVEEEKPEEVEEEEEPTEEPKEEEEEKEEEKPEPAEEEKPEEAKEEEEPAEEAKEEEKEEEKPEPAEEEKTEEAKEEEKPAEEPTEEEKPTESEEIEVELSDSSGDK